MIESAISDEHHYYLMVFKPEQKKTLNQLLARLTDDENSIRLINSREFHAYRCQKKIIKVYSKRDFLSKNYHKDGSVWYDFYVGDLILKQDILFFICFPYKGIQRELRDKILPDYLQNAIYFKPSLEHILEYMRNRTNVEEKRIEDMLNSSTKSKKHIFSADIVRYTAHVKDLLSEKVQMTGKNPLNSKVFQILKNPENELSLETSSMKLCCKMLIEDIKTRQTITASNIDILFDHYGNYRFWLPYYEEDTASPTIDMINTLFKFFDGIDAFQDENNRQLSDKEDLE